MGKTITAGFISDTINGIGINSSIKCNNDNLNNNTSRSVAYVVMHYTGNSKDTAKANANYFSGAGRNASAHFFVDDAEIYQSVELRDTAWHCGAKSYKHGSCRNANSIGIECVVLLETTEFQTGQKKTLHTFVHFFVKCLELVQVALIPMYYAIMT